MFGVMTFNVRDNFCSLIQPLDSNHHLMMFFMVQNKTCKYLKQTTPLYWHNNTAEWADNTKCNFIVPKVDELYIDKYLHFIDNYN